MKVAPLLRFVPDVNMAEAFFTSKMERCGLALLQKKDAAAIINSIREDVDCCLQALRRCRKKLF